MTIANSINVASATKYVVDATGNAPYSTIQSALDAANAAGIPAEVIVRSGTYTENLTLYTDIKIVCYGNNFDDKIIIYFDYWIFFH